jgi:hypothetical protein
MGAIGAITSVVATAVTAVVTGPNTTERTAKSVTWPNGNGSDLLFTYLRSRMASGQTIYAEDINSLASLINNMNGHYHTYDDARQLKTYGNNGDKVNYYEDKITGYLVGVTDVATNTAADTSITAARHNELAASVNILRIHKHIIDDKLVK